MIVKLLSDKGVLVTDKQTNHENLVERDNVNIGGDRTFGFVFAIVFVVVALLPVLAGSGQHNTVRVWALVVSAVFAITALARPQMLTPLNKIWIRFGLLLHKIVNPLIMGLIFFLVITPIGLVMRSLGKKPLKTGFDKSVGSYWIDRVPPGPAPDSMKRQF